MSRQKISYTALIVAASAHWVLGAIWFSVFAAPWLAGIGRTRADLTHRGSPAIVYLAAFASSLALAWTIAWLTASTGRLTMIRGMMSAGLLWLGLVCATMATELAFEGRSFEVFAITAGYPLVGMLIMGAILGRWTRGTGDQKANP